MNKQEKQPFNTEIKPIASAIHFILYVEDQTKSAIFYSSTLGIDPTLNVPGMTEFSLAGGVVLGLMPCKGIRKLLGEQLPDPTNAHGIPRSEIYLIVPDPQIYHERALEAGASELSPLQPRDWGDTVAYSLDPDGHVLAFASRK